MGKYINNNLLPGETVIFEAEYHWIHFLNIPSFLSLFIIPFLHQYFHEFAVTNRRIILKKGILFVDTFEINLGRVESVQINKSVLGSILNYGDITIIGTGGTVEIFKGIRNPSAFRAHFMENI